MLSTGVQKTADIGTRDSIVLWCSLMLSTGVKKTADIGTCDSIVLWCSLI